MLNKEQIYDLIKNDDVLHGKNHYDEELLGLKFKVSFYSFFQTNPLGAAKDKRVMELFSGTGTIGQIISK